MNAAGEILGSGRIPPGVVLMSRRIARLSGDPSDQAVLSIALALLAVDNGSVLVDLRNPDLALPPIEVNDSPVEWPDPAEWRQALSSSPVASGADAPLCLEGDHVYLQRYWRAEQRISETLTDRIGHLSLGGHRPDVDLSLDAVQRTAVESVMVNRVTIITGGPGTGKTHTIAHVLRALNGPGGSGPSVALAAPTGKAAARMKQAIALSGVFPSDETGGVDRMEATTLHRLLGPVPGTVTTFRRNAESLLPHDVVIVDESSMVDVAMLDALLKALRPDARLVLVGDADQLASVAAGNALADLVSSQVVPTVRLSHNYRNRGGIPLLAQAIRDGDAHRVDELLVQQGDLHRFEVGDRLPELVREWLADWGASVRKAAAAGDITRALSAVERVRVLCAHRRGRFGVEQWSSHVMTQVRPGRGPFPLGQPMMVTKNHVAPGLYNGDTGVVVDLAGEVRVAFENDIVVAPDRLGTEAVAAYCLTIHKAQGSQFGRVVVVLPDAQSRILTRELLYTAVTRARSEVAIVGSREALHAALERRISRPSGLASRLRAGIA